MKKYFSLFTTSFMVLEACLIAASSPSHGMEELIEGSETLIKKIPVSFERIQKIQKRIEEFKNVHDIQGTLAVGKSGQVIYVATDGNCGTISCMEDTQYPIGSLTKQFTAAALLREVLNFSCEGNINYLKEHMNKPIIHFLNKSDEIWGEKQAPEWAKKVTLHHLLSNTSGLKDVSIPTYLEFGKTPRTRSELVDLYCKNNEILSFEPGSRYEYSNPNFFFAGVVTERLTGKTLGEYLQTTFFEPLQMTGTFLPEIGTVATLRKTGKYSKLALGYMYSFKDKNAPFSPVTEYFSADINQGDGGVISTVGDLVKWNHALYETDFILPSAAKELMLTPMSLSGEEQSTYGYGIEVMKDGNERVIYTHEGLVPGYHSILFYDPAHKLTLVQLSNVFGDLRQYIDIMEKQAAIQSSNSEEKELKIKSLDKEYPVAGEQNEKYRLIGWKDIEETLNPAADLRLNPGKGETLWFEEKQIWCHHSYLDGKVYSFQYSEFIEITLSYPALNSELLGLAFDLHAYNVGKTGEISEKGLIASYKSIDGNSTISFKGELQQQGLYLAWEEEDIKRAPNAAVILLREIQRRAQQTGIHSIYIVSPVLVGPYRNVPSEEGFHLTGYDAGDKTQFYYKTARQFFNDSQEDNPHVTLQYVEEEGFSPPNFGSCFGIFIRNDKGLVQGGVFGNLHKQASLPYGSIEVFWVDEAIRSAGFGKKAFSLAENFLKESGAQMIELGTADHQAPWFYKKMGYAPVIIFPETTKTLDGKWSNHYKFEKRL